MKNGALQMSRQNMKAKNKRQKTTESINFI